VVPRVPRTRIDRRSLQPRTSAQTVTPTPSSDSTKHSIPIRVLYVSSMLFQLNVLVVFLIWSSTCTRRLASSVLRGLHEVISTTPASKWLCQSRISYASSQAQIGIN
jgi:hypothetical protein